MRHLRVLLIAIGTLAVLRAYAQPRLRTPEMYIGVHGGALASMTLFTPAVPGTSDILETTLLSGNGGIVFRYSGHKCCGLQVELNYMRRGWRENTTDSLDIHYKRQLDYIELPFLAHIYFGKKAVKGFVNLGPQIGYCLHDSQSGTQHPVKRVQYAPLDNCFDWGVAGGLGMLVHTKTVGAFQLEARFNYSFGNYFNDSKRDYFNNSNPINLSLNVGYLWNISKKHK